MEEKILKATHPGVLTIGAIKIPCAVLEGGIRVLTQQGVLRSIGRARAAKGGEGASVDGLPAFLRANNLKPFISKELEESTRPIIFKPDKGGKAFGYRAETLPMICQVFLEARDAKKLHKNQEHIAKTADILIRGLAHIGIIALVDEATGYQEVRDRIALQTILDKYLLKEYAKWAKRFPDEFYELMFKLKGWEWKGMKVNRPSVVGRYTNDLVYQRLAPGILDELRLRNPPDEHGRRKTKHHMWLTDEIGHPALQQHLATIIAFMRAAANWGQLERMVERAFTKFNHTIPIIFEEETKNE